MSLGSWKQLVACAHSCFHSPFLGRLFELLASEQVEEPSSSRASLGIDSPMRSSWPCAAWWGLWLMSRWLYALCALYVLFCLSCLVFFAWAPSYYFFGLPANVSYQYYQMHSLDHALDSELSPVCFGLLLPTGFGRKRLISSFVLQRSC